MQAGAAKIEQLKFSFTYQVGNFREMIAFVDFAKSFHCDLVIFEGGCRTSGPSRGRSSRDQAVHLGEHPLHPEFLAVVGNPIFGEPAVWHDFEWQGAARLSEEERAGPPRQKEASGRKWTRRSGCPRAMPARPPQLAKPEHAPVPVARFVAVADLAPFRPVRQRAGTSGERKSSKRIEPR